MRVVGIKALKNKLSEYVRLASSGETVLVTDRDRVVAELGPCQPGSAPTRADAELAEAVRSGLLTPPLFAGGGPFPRRPVMRLQQILDGFDEDRAER